jgi:hypothetical protein
VQEKEDAKFQTGFSVKKDVNHEAGVSLYNT